MTNMDDYITRQVIEYQSRYTHPMILEPMTLGVN